MTRGRERQSVRPGAFGFCNQDSRTSRRTQAASRGQGPWSSSADAARLAIDSGEFSHLEFTDPMMCSPIACVSLLRLLDWDPSCSSASRSSAGSTRANRWVGVPGHRPAWVGVSFGYRWRAQGKPGEAALPVGQRRSRGRLPRRTFQPRMARVQARAGCGRAGRGIRSVESGAKGVGQLDPRAAMPKSSKCWNC